MQELQLFRNHEFGEIRTITESDKILFCGSDVAKALGYANTNDAITRHCKTDGVAFHDLTDNLGRQQSAKFINEGNVYRLICGSKLPTAEKFEKWVFDDVLPKIRKTGSYQRPMTQVELLAAQAQVLVDMERKVAETSQIAFSTADKLDKALDVFTKPISESWKDETNRKINAMISEYGLNYQAFRSTLYRELEESAKCDLTARQRNLRARLKQNGAKYKECQAITKIDVVSRNDKLRLIFDGIVKRYQSKYINAN